MGPPLTTTHLQTSLLRDLGGRDLLVLASRGSYAVQAEEQVSGSRRCDVLPRLRVLMVLVLSIVVG
jgi:hypothetical protein